jgi:hypothetical protein
VVLKARVVEMISSKLTLYCFVVSGAYLLVFSLVWEWLAKQTKAFRGIPTEMLEETGVLWFGVNFATEFLLYTVIPTFAYAFFYIIVPLTGLRAGVAAALFAFTLGTLPVLIGLLVRIKLPALTFAWMMLGSLLKLAGSLTIIAYLYSL